MKRIDATQLIPPCHDTKPYASKSFGKSKPHCACNDMCASLIEYRSKRYHGAAPRWSTTGVV